MANYTQLCCINDILLKKIKAIQKQHKLQIKKHERQLNKAHELFESLQDSISDHEWNYIHSCCGCDLYHKQEEGEHNCGGDFYCEECSSEHNIRCDCCMELYENDSILTIVNKQSKVICGDCLEDIQRANFLNVKKDIHKLKTSPIEEHKAKMKKTLEHISYEGMLFREQYDGYYYYQFSQLYFKRTCDCFKGASWLCEYRKKKRRNAWKTLIAIGRRN